MLVVVLFLLCHLPCDLAFTMLAVSKATLHFEFKRIPYAAGVHHIHSPEYLSDVHNLGGHFFRIDEVDAPRLCTNGKVSVMFNCSTIFIRNMRVRMFASQPNESVLRAFTAHRLRMDITFFDASRATLKSLLPVFFFVDGIRRDRYDFRSDVLTEHAHFTQYRRAVLRGESSDDFWIMADRVMRNYSG